MSLNRSPHDVYAVVMERCAVMMNLGWEAGGKGVKFVSRRQMDYWSGRTDFGDIWRFG